MEFEVHFPFIFNDKVVLGCSRLVGMKEVRLPIAFGDYLRLLGHES